MFNPCYPNITAATSFAFNQISTLYCKASINNIVNLRWHTFKLISNFTTFNFNHLLFIRLKDIFQILLNNVRNTHGLSSFILYLCFILYILFLSILTIYLLYNISYTIKSNIYIILNFANLIIKK